jgi:hypothetical protein
LTASFVYCEKMNKKEFRVSMIIAFIIIGEKNTVEAKAWLDKHYSDSAPRKSTVEKSLVEFRGPWTV